jgi:hypothetical protein
MAWSVLSASFAAPTVSSISPPQRERPDVRVFVAALPR